MTRSFKSVAGRTVSVVELGTKGFVFGASGKIVWPRGIIQFFRRKWERSYAVSCKHATHRRLPQPVQPVVHLRCGERGLPVQRRTFRVSARS